MPGSPSGQAPLQPAIRELLTIIQHLISYLCCSTPRLTDVHIRMARHDPKVPATKLPNLSSSPLGHIRDFVLTAQRRHSSTATSAALSLQTICTRRLFLSMQRWLVQGIVRAVPGSQGLDSQLFLRCDMLHEAEHCDTTGHRMRASGREWQQIS